MAIRFVDFQKQLDPNGPRRFGFWNSEDAVHVDGMLSFGGVEAWATWDEFERDSAETNRGPYEVQLDVFRALCPPWVFGDTAPPDDVPGLLRVASDALKEAGHEDMGEAVFEAAAYVEAFEGRRSKLAWPL